MGKIAFCFAGQGAQATGMGKSLYECSAAARRILDEAEGLRTGTLQQCFEGTKETLSLTVNTQPCLMAVDCACAAALIERGIEPQLLAGFSLGEIAALPFSGLLSFADAFRLVVKRGEWMHRCAEQSESGMVAVVKLEDAAVEALCEEHHAYPVNYNCPGQVVCAMRKQELAPFTDAVKAAGGRALPLAVSGGFHSPLMHDAAENMRRYADGLSFAQPKLPLYANRTCQPYTVQSASQLLGEQIESPVRWTKLIRQMQADGATDFIEVGAGKTLTGLIAKIGGAQRMARVEDEATLEETVRQYKEEPSC